MLVIMSLDSRQTQAISEYNEVVAEKRFRKMGFAVDCLDRQGPRSRPEFLVSDSTGSVLVSEVKTIFSAGYLQDRNAHASTLDTSLAGTGVYGVDIDFREDVLEDSVRKYRCLIEDHPEFKNVPFAVVLFADWLADHFNLRPRRMERFPDISGLLKVEKDFEILQVVKGMSLEDLRDRIATGSMKRLPASSKQFRLLENECATQRLPEHFVSRCIVS